jgi:hypothetical protein
MSAKVGRLPFWCEAARVASATGEVGSTCAAENGVVQPATTKAEKPISTPRRTILPVSPFILSQVLCDDRGERKTARFRLRTERQKRSGKNQHGHGENTDQAEESSRDQGEVRLG